MDGMHMVNGSGAVDSPTFDRIFRRAAGILARTSMALSDKQIAATAGTIASVGEAIHDLGSVPSGHLYAQLMGHMTLGSYQAVITFLTHAGMVRQEASHMLVWVEEAGV